MSKQTRNMLDDDCFVAKIWEPGIDGNCKCNIGEKCTDCDKCKGEDALQPMSPGKYIHYREEEEQQPLRKTDDQANVLASMRSSTLAERKAMAKALANKKAAKKVKAILPDRFTGVLSPGQAAFAASLKLPKE